MLVSGRALIIGLLALIEKLRPAPADHPDYQPHCHRPDPRLQRGSRDSSTPSIAALASNYPKLEVLVIDDGSTDHTAELVRENFGRDPRVRLLLQPNRGKPTALNHGLAEATGEIVVSIDADTIVDPEAIPLLVRHFRRSQGRRGRRQRESDESQSLDHALAGARIHHQPESRKARVRSAELHSGGAGRGGRVARGRCCAATEDFQAIRWRKIPTSRSPSVANGWKILYDEDAIGRTEVPETVDALIRQRFRWTFGTLQAVWKHRDTVGKPRYGTLGWVAIPNIFLFQILLPLVSPVIDLLFLLSHRALGLWRSFASRACRNCGHRRTWSAR